MDEGGRAEAIAERSLDMMARLLGVLASKGLLNLREMDAIISNPCDRIIAVETAEPTPSPAPGPR